MMYAYTTSIGLSMKSKVLRTLKKVLVFIFLVDVTVRHIARPIIKQVTLISNN